MIAHTWKFAEVKEVIFALLLISLCFVAINGAPVTKKMKFTPKEEIDGFSENNEYLSVMMRSFPILKRLTQYFATLNNKDLLSVRGTCKSFHGLASKLLNMRTKPVIITNGTINDSIDQQIFSAYQKLYINNFLMFRRWQPKIALLFDYCNNPTSIRNMPFDCLYFQIVPHNNRLDIFMNIPSGGMLCNNHPRSAVIIPKMHDASVNNGYFSTDDKPSTAMRKAKLILFFRTSFLLPYDIESVINTEIAPYIESQSVPICYALHLDETRFHRSNGLFVIFSGSNVETSTFLVESTDEEKLRDEFSKWKSELDFLESHHIISFHFTKESTEPTNSEEIFRETFGIQPVTLRLSASDLAETGLIYSNSVTMARKNPGSVYAIVGYKKF